MKTKQYPCSPSEVQAVLDRADGDVETLEAMLAVIEHLISMRNRRADSNTSDDSKTDA
jgi:hypothetical protein